MFLREPHLMRATSPLEPSSTENLLNYLRDLQGLRVRNRSVVVCGRFSSLAVSLEIECFGFLNLNIIQRDYYSSCTLEDNIHYTYSYSLFALVILIDADLVDPDPFAF